MNVRIVLVEPEYEINLGYIARAMGNFGLEELFLVKPKAKIGFRARMFSKHALPILKNACTVEKFEDAARGCDFVVGTTGIPKKGRDTLRNPLSPREFAERAKGMKGKFALVFGRDGSGLNAEEIKKCDFLVSVPTDKKYPILNISHAVAIILYELSLMKRKYMIKTAGREEREMLLKTFGELVDFYAPKMRNSSKVKLAFKRIVGRALSSDLETAALLGVLRRAVAEIGENRKTGK